VYGSVQRHGGAITVESTPGNGATFRVFWPAATRLTETSAPTPRSFGSGLPRGDNRHVLVVDDELGIVRVIAASLKRLGYQVTTCTDPREALASFEATPDSFDVVLTDLSMPHMSGLELGRSLLDLRADLPIVLFTGYNADLSAETVHAAGFRALLSKPTTPSSLAAVLHQTLHSA
jgi:CheY-like chemotaxis protein